MPLTFNGDTPERIIYNNNVVDKVKYGDDVVWEAPIPHEYEEVGYLLADKRLDLGIKTDQNKHIYCEFIRVSRTKSQRIYGSDVSGSLTTNTSAYISSTSTSVNWRFGNKTTNISVSLGEHTSVQNKNGVWIDGTKEGSYTDVNDFVSNNNLSLFDNLTGGASECNVAISRMLVREIDGQPGVPDHRWVAVKRLSDNVYGFYDTVTKNFHTNDEAEIIEYVEPQEDA